MSRLKIFLSVCLILGLGFLAGALFSRVLIQQRIEKHFFAKEPPGIHFLQRMTARLDLTASQQKAIQKIIDNARIELIAYRQKYRPEFQKQLDDTLVKIKAELNDSQKEKLDRFTKRVKKRLRRHHSGPFPKPPMQSLTAEELMNELVIDDSQKKVVHALLATHMAQKNKIERKFHDAQRQIREQHKSDMGSLDRDVIKQLRKSLSDDQLKKAQRLLMADYPFK